MNIHKIKIRLMFEWLNYQMIHLVKVIFRKWWEMIQMVDHSGDN